MIFAHQLPQFLRVLFLDGLFRFIHDRANRLDCIRASLLCSRVDDAVLQGTDMLHRLLCISSNTRIGNHEVRWHIKVERL